MPEMDQSNTMRKIGIKVVTLTQGENNDFSVTLFNTEEEAFQRVKEEEGDENFTMDCFVSNPRKYGSIGKGNLKLIEKDDGGFALEESYYGNYFVACL